MGIYDVSMEIHENMMVYKNKPEKKPRRNIQFDYETSGMNESEITMGLHTGTHIDAPFHMLDMGDTIEKIDLNNLIGKAEVLDMTHIEDRITAKDLEDKPIIKDGFILFKTKNSMTEEYENDFVFLEKSGAQYLKDKGITGVGIDSLGIERNQPGHETHTILLGSGCIIIEGLRLKGIDEGEYMMYALPLKIKGGDGAPARVILADL